MHFTYSFLQVVPDSLRRGSVLFRSTLSIIDSEPSTPKKLSNSSSKKSSFLDMFDFDPITTAPNSRRGSRDDDLSADGSNHSNSSLADSTFLNLESLLTPELLQGKLATAPQMFQRKLSMIQDILKAPKKSMDEEPDTPAPTKPGEVKED